MMRTLASVPNQGSYPNTAPHIQPHPEHVQQYPPPSITPAMLGTSVASGSVARENEMEPPQRRSSVSLSAPCRACRCHVLTSGQTGVGPPARASRARREASWQLAAWGCDPTVGSIPSAEASARTFAQKAGALDPPNLWLQCNQAGSFSDIGGVKRLPPPPPKPHGGTLVHSDTRGTFLTARLLRLACPLSLPPPSIPP